MNQITLPKSTKASSQSQDDQNLTVASDSPAATNDQTVQVAQAGTVQEIHTPQPQSATQSAVQPQVNPSPNASAPSTAAAPVAPAPVNQPFAPTPAGGFNSGFGAPPPRAGGNFGGYNSSFPDPFADDPWGDSWDNGGSNFGGAGGGMSKPAARLTPQERVAMIEKVYQDILGRKPDTRDINYYKYSSLGEEDIRKELLTGKEHQQLVTDGREFKTTSQNLSKAEVKIKSLEGQIQDQVNELTQLNSLLQEKNVHISKLRDQLDNPFIYASMTNRSRKVTRIIPHSQAIQAQNAEVVAEVNANTAAPAQIQQQATPALAETVQVSSNQFTQESGASPSPVPQPELKQEQPAVAPQAPKEKSFWVRLGENLRNILSVD